MSLCKTRFLSKSYSHSEIHHTVKYENNSMEKTCGRPACSHVRKDVVKGKLGDKPERCLCMDFGTNERKVLVIYTGGTIGMLDNPEGFLCPKKNVFETLMRQFPQLHDQVLWEKLSEDHPTFDKSFLVMPKTKEIRWRILYKIYEYETLLDSSNMDEDDWVRIAKDIQKYYEQYDGFVVLHGTDTLCYTASALSFMCENIGKAVVLTGSQIPIFEPRSDGVDNFVSSLLIAGSQNIPEVTIFFSGRLLRGNRSRKISATQFHAFDSPNCVPLIQVALDFEVNKAAIFKPYVIDKFTVTPNMSKNVGLLRIFPSISTAVVKAFCSPPIEGVVLESYGAGNLPSNRPDLFQVIEDAVKRGVILVVITQCMSGAVSNLYETGQLLEKYGVVSGADMTPEAALTKLSYVLAKTELSYKEKTEMMQKNIRGELTSIAAIEIHDKSLKNALGTSLNIQSPKVLEEVSATVVTSLLLHGIEHDDLAVIKKLIDMGADVNSQVSQDRSPLHKAVVRGNVAIVEYLLKKGANVHTKTSSGECPLLTAAYNNNESMIELLIRCGAHLASADKNALTQMMAMAVKNMSIRRLESLKKAGADLDMPDDLLQTPLHKAVVYNSTEVAAYLIENGADKENRDFINFTPLDYAMKLKRNSLMASLSFTENK